MQSKLLPRTRRNVTTKMSEANNLVYICVHCGQVVENKDSDWHDSQCPAKNINADDDQDDIELNVDEVEEESPEEKQVEKDDYVLRLINAVRLRTTLWDKYQKRDLSKRQECWSEIEQELGSEPGVPRRDWTHLREKYRGERSYINKAAHAGRSVGPRWEYYNHLAFLEQDERSQPRKQIPAKNAAKVVSTKIISVNGKKVMTRNHLRGKPGPKPGSTRRKSVPQKPITRPKRTHKPTHPEAMKTMNVAASERAKLNELRVVVSRNDYRDLTTTKSINNMSAMNDSNSRKRTSQSDVEAITFKQVCIRNTEEGQLNNANDVDTVGKFCSYLEVMLRTLPKEKQEVFYEETLDHLATLKRQIRRSNHSNPATNYM